MSKFVLPALLAMVVSAWPVMAHGAGPVLREDAEVFANGGSRLLYRETHWVVPGSQAVRWVVYECPDGTPFARKKVTGVANSTTPNFSLEDGRDGYREGVRGGARRTVFVDEGADTGEQTQTLAVPADGVIDAGFDQAVKAAWPRLMKGEAVRMQFLVPSRKRFYPVRVERVGAVEKRGVAAEQLRMTLDAWFGFAAPEVDLAYSKQDRRLLEFSGTGNVRDARGRNPQVRIAFDAKARQASPAAMKAAVGEPLVGRCRF